MNRGDFKRLANLRIRESKVLLDRRMYAGAYYLAGYAVECALKACIAKQFRRYDFPEKKLVNDSYTHDLRKLLGLVQDVKAELEKELKSNSSFNVNWNTVIQWDEDARYVANVTQALATNLYTAIADQSNGVLTWLKKYW